MSLLVLLGSFMLGQPEPAATWLSASDYDRVTLVVADGDAAGADAAVILADYWERVSGFRPDVGPGGSGTARIYIGAAASGTGGEAGLDAGLAEQAVRIKTLRPGALAITGGSALGVEFAVYQFVEDYLGVRWLEPEYTYIPESPQDIPWIDFTYEPPFEYRWSTYLQKVPGIAEWRKTQRWNEGPGFVAHTAYHLVPPEEFYPEHPDYFSEIDGERVAPWDIDYHSWDVKRENHDRLGQLCMTNPGVIAVISEKIKERIRANPAQRVHHVSQEDWFSYCECATCAAIDAEEESHMGAPLYGLNRIAENVAAEFPGYGIETLAYQFTRKPPKHMRPAANLYIKLCSIECDFSKPLGDPASRLNKQFADDIRAWSAIAERLHIWDYTTNFRNFQSPIPNFDVIQPNMQFYVEHNVKAMYEQGSYDAGAEFAHLRAYLVSKLLWDPYVDLKARQDEFLRLYYGPAADHVARYIAMLDAKAEAEHAIVGCFDRGGWYDASLVKEAEALFAEAFDAIEGHHAIDLRLRRLYATVQFAALKCPPEISREGNELVLRRPPSQDLDTYLAMLKELGVDTIVDFFQFDEVYRQLGHEAPPREERTPLLVLRHGESEVWVLPERDGAIIRWHDGATGIEALRGYESLEQFPCTWEDWNSHADRPQEHVADSYEVTAAGPEEATLRATLASGLVLERTMRLSAEGLEGEWRLSNPTDTAQPCTVKIHPEFWAQGAFVPDLFVRDSGGWRLHGGDAPRETVRADRFPAKGLSGFAAYIRERDVRIEAGFSDRDMAELMYFMNIDSASQQVNVELLPDAAPIAPGGAREWRATYRIAKGKP